MPRQNNNSKVDRLAQHIRGMQPINNLLMNLASGGPCELIDEKPFQGTSTPEGDACRIRARARYLLDVLDCEHEPNRTPSCCEDAAQAYYDAWEACPD
jgi:hypothetical protein